MNNPYAGQDPSYERAWADGYDYARNHPAEQNPQAPTVFPPMELDDQTLGWMQQVWREGVLAAQQDHAGGDVHPEQHHVPYDVTDVHSELGTEMGHVAEGSVLLYGLYHAYQASKLVAELPVAALEAFLMVAIPSGPRDAPHDQDLHLWFKAECETGGWNDIYVPVQWGEGQQATWYGHAYSDYASAEAELRKHFEDGGKQAEFWMELAHYQCGAPDIIEIVGFKAQPVAESAAAH